jgi:glycosyltransferase involved in cell wall biosynthesis
MRKLYYMGLEPYEGRYTLQLQEWSERAFKRHGIDYIIVPGTTIDNTRAIQVGQVLDAHGRSYFAMSQMMNLVQMMRNGEVTGEDVVFFEDMFQPGMESLPYIMDQIPAEQRPQVWIRCLAQAVDPDDFVHVWGMGKWMSLYEEMCNEFVTPLYNVSGLAFDKGEVQERVNNHIIPFEDRSRRVVFAARWDQEKQPDFFMDIAEAYPEEDIEFAVLQGGPLRSNNPKYIDRAKALEAAGKIRIYEDLGKNDYYNILNDSRVLFNCALQDWTSNTVSEADALGCNVLFPAYRSFPEIFANDHTRLYVPWSKEDATAKMHQLLAEPHKDLGKISDWTGATIDRYIDIMSGNGEQWRRDDNRYRDHVAERKY